MDNCKISVIVPVYNVEHTISPCLDSIISQTYKNIEVIIVDDGSTDKSGDIADEYGKKDKRIKVFHKKNGGLSDARNFGIKKATGEYVTFVDSDDFLEKGIYGCSMDAIKKTKSDILVFEIERDSISKKKVLKITKEEKLDRDMAIIKLNTFNNIDYSACNKIFKKSLFRDIEFPFGKKCEDVYIMYKLFYKAKSVYIYPKIGYHYCFRQGSITNSQSVNYDFANALKEQMMYFDNETTPQCVKDITKSAYAYGCLTVVNMMLVKKNKDKASLLKMREAAKKYSKYVYCNKYLRLNKKMQFFIFSKTFFFYKLAMAVKI